MLATCLKGISSKILLLFIDPAASELRSAGGGGGEYILYKGEAGYIFPENLILKFLCC
jgi:hypothetical protein